MSAIAGIIFFDAQSDAQQFLIPMMNALSYWGKDRQNTWTNSHVALGHMLHIHTPEDKYDNQPYTEHNTDITIISASRLDNRDELFKYFGISVQEQKTTTDSNLIFKAYKRWGEDCVKYLLGDFSFCIWNNKEKELFCARDPFGTLPLYYHRANNFIAFATQPKGLYCLKNIPRKFNLEAWARFNLPGIVSSIDETMFESIQRIPAGHTVILSQKHTTTKRYWDPRDAPRIHYRTRESYMEHFREIFFESVKCRLRTNKPAGILLSGGLDSAAVACIAASILSERGKKLYAFCYRPLKQFDKTLPKNRIADETPYIKAIGERWSNIDITYDRAEGRDIFTNLERIFNELDQYPPSPRELWIDPLFQIAQQEKIGIVLTGQSGNLGLSFDGSGYLYDLLLSGKWRHLISEIKKESASQKISISSLIKHEILGQAIPQWLTKLYKYSNNTSRGNMLPIHPDLIKHATGMNIDDYRWPLPGINYSGMHNLLRKLWKKRPLSQTNEYWSTKAAAYNMMSSDPTQDLRLIEFCLGIPGEMFRNKGKKRLLVREALSEYIPEVVLTRNNRGQQDCDISDRMPNFQKQIDEEIMQFRQLPVTSQMFDFSQLKNAYSQLISSKSPSSYYNAQLQITRALMHARFAIWIQKN